MGVFAASVDSVAVPVAAAAASKTAGAGAAVAAAAVAAVAPASVAVAAAAAPRLTAAQRSKRARDDGDAAASVEPTAKRSVQVQATMERFSRRSAHDHNGAKRMQGQTPSL